MRALFRALLRAYPPGFRARFGREILAQAEADCDRAFERGAVAGCRCVVGTSLDLVRAGLAERWWPVWVDGADRHSRDRRGAYGRGDDDEDVDSELETGAGTMTGRDERTGRSERTGRGERTGSWIRDLRHAARTLGRSPGFALAAVGTLAIALGANAGIFSVVDAVLLRPLPYDDPGELVQIAGSAPGSDLPEEFALSAEFFLHYRDQASQLEDVAAFNSFTATVRAGDRVERLRQSLPSPSLFRTLGARPVVGRLPRDGEGGRVAVISHGLWTTWFGADPSVIGRSYEFVGGEREVIGVMGPEFRFPNAEVVAWVPFDFRAEDVVPGRFGEIQLVGRLAPGADQASLARELQTLAARLPELYGGSPSYARTMERHVPVVRPLREFMLGDVRGALWVLMAAVAVVLLIACANVASLLSVRAEGRGRDLAVRRALGAGRGALVRAQLAETLVIAAVAGLGALVLARLALPAFVAAAPDGLPRVDDVGVSASTLLFTVVASALAALVCGLVPAVRSSAPALDRLRDGTRGSTRRRHWGRDALVVGQTALALLLLIGSGLLLRSFEQLRGVDPGYDTRDILTFQFAPEQAHLSDGPSWAAFHLEFMDRLWALPGVETVGIVENVPLDEGLQGLGFQTEASAAVDPEATSRASLTFAGGDYFEAMGIEVLEGRGFTDDDAVLPGNVVVSRAAADLLWPGESPLGRHLRNTTVEGWHTVVGVVEDVLQYDLRGEPEALVYYPLVGPTPDAWALSSPGYVVRTPRAEVIAPEIRALVAEVAPRAPMYRVHTMEALVDRSMVQLSFTMLTLAVAAGLALVLGAIGLYGVLSYLVAQRTGEIGVRLALGAGAARVRWMVVGQGARVVGLGIVIGLAASLLGTRALSSLLYGVAPADPWTFGGMALAMAAVGLLASYVPARRASLVDPVQSMRTG